MNYLAGHGMKKTQKDQVSIKRRPSLFPLINTIAIVEAL